MASERISTITWASDISPRIDPYPDGVDPYPALGSTSGSYNLQTFDLITPDGCRAWVIAGWDDQGNIRAWTTSDFVENRKPSKTIPDHVSRYAPLCHINSSAELREQFISDYLVVGTTLEQEYHFGIVAPTNPSDWVGLKVYKYGGGHQYVIRDYDTFYRTLTVDDRDGNLSIIDMLDMMAAWHEPYNSKVPRARLRPQPSGDQYLYRLYNKGGALLYVGITDNPFRRWKEHSKEKPWWPEVHTFTQDWFPDRTSVELAERRAIASEGPAYNIIRPKGATV